MQAFTTLSGIAAPLPMINVDTDKIIPKQFLKTIHRSGLGKSLFHEMRYADDDTENSAFILNQEPFRGAQVLVTGSNFGCGSSREHAPWALLDFGIRCIIAPSFADIFYNNCFKNGILPVVLPQAEVNKMMGLAGQAATLTIDLHTREIRSPTGEVTRFEIDDFRRHCLLNGLDDIGLTLEKGDHIDRFEERHYEAHPWLIMP
ncbi:MAG: 3-isopropylmalate dehydratase small subunit [Rhodospirillales bacterium]|nr:3-isopropylmalate dehydratase small subunit [Rhodospirillales bacterium]